MARVIGRGGIDYPDLFTQPRPHETTVAIDLAELAVRLGSPHIFEQSGNLLYQEQFSNGFGAWNIGGWPVAAYPVIDASYCYHVPYSCKFVTTGLAEDYSFISQALPYPYVSSFGLQFSFLARSEFDYLSAEMYVYTGSLYYRLIVRVDNTNDRIRIYGGPGIYYNVQDYDLGLGATSGWHTVKIVADFVNQKYVRGLIDGKDFSLADYDIRVTDSVTDPHLWLYFILSEGLARVDAVWLDNILLTLNEPVS